LSEKKLKYILEAYFILSSSIQITVVLPICEIFADR